MLDQNTDRMWYVIGAVLIGGLIIVSSVMLFSDTVFAGIGDTFGNYIDSVPEDIGYERLEFTMDEVRPWANDGVFERVSDTSIKFGTDPRYRGGVVIPTKYFEYGESYKVSFDITVLEGSVEGIGGHLFFSDDVDILIDGEKPDIWEKGAIVGIDGEKNNPNKINDWSLGVEFPNTKNKTHHIELYFKRNIKDVDLTLDENRFYLQPNRTRGSHWSINKIPYVVLLEDMTIDKNVESGD